MLLTPSEYGPSRYQLKTSGAAALWDLISANMNLYEHFPNCLLLRNNSDGLILWGKSSYINKKLRIYPYNNSNRLHKNRASKWLQKAWYKE